MEKNRLLRLKKEVKFVFHKVKFSKPKPKKDDNTEMIRSLVEAGADANAKDKNGFTPLFFAAGTQKLDDPQIITPQKHQKKESLKEAVASVASALDKGEYPNFPTDMSNEKDVVQLLELGSSPNNKSNRRLLLYSCAWHFLALSTKG